MSVFARLREPRRLLAIVLLTLAGAAIFALIWARGSLAGSDALAYWTAVHRWLAGEDIYQVLPGLYLPPTEGVLPYAYAPWSLYLFLPWALLPWDVAWFSWRAANLALLGASILWAYDRRPLGTAVFIAVLAPSIATNLDTGNINILIALAAWVGYWARGWIGGTLWALGTGLKYLPVVLLPFIRREAWRPGFAVLGVIAILSLATWPETVRQLDIALTYPRPLRLDYLVLAWGVVPWLYARAWPPRLSREWLRERAAFGGVAQPTAAQ
jgi:hypothetical protein